MANVKYVVVDASGAVQGMGANDLSLIGQMVPEGCTWFRQDGSLPMSIEQIPVAPALLDPGTVYGLQGGVFGPVAVLDTMVVLPSPALTEVQAQAVTQVNATCAAVRSRYITVLPGQEMIYLAKEAEALRYLAQAPVTLDGYPLLAAEVGITAPTAYQLAQLWANMSSLWRGVAAQIEAVRMTAIYAIEAAPDAAAVETAVQAAVAALAQA